MAKKKAEKPKREMTKRQLSRWQQQERRRRFILGSGIGVLVVVLGIVGVGVYNQWYVLEYKPLGETVIEVNDTKFTMDYYVKMLKFYTRDMSTEYIQYMADAVVQAIERNELVRQEAVKLSISVSDEEVDKQLNSSDPPLSRDYRDAVRAQLLMDKLRDEYFDKQVPTSAEQRHIWAMFLESESQANEVRARLEAGEDFAELAGELSLDTIYKEQKGDLGWHPEGVLALKLGDPLVDEYAFSAEAGSLSQPIFDENKTKMVGYWLVKVIERDETAGRAYVKVILLGNEQEANEARARLEAGEDFAELAKELSQHDASKENGGDFVMTPEDPLTQELKDFVFSSELEVLSQVIRDDTASTKGGYWLVKVTEIENNRQIEDDDRQLLVNDALNKWVEGLINNPENKVNNYLDADKIQWAIAHATGG